jgi:hypothetical protein
MKKFTKKQIVLVVLVVVCTVLFVGVTWFLIDNLINALRIFEAPNILRNKALVIDISLQLTFSLFYGLFVWLAITIIKSPNNPHK